MRESQVSVGVRTKDMIKWEWLTKWHEGVGVITSRAPSHAAEHKEAPGETFVSLPVSHRCSRRFCIQSWEGAFTNVPVRRGGCTVDQQTPGFCHRRRSLKGRRHIIVPLLPRCSCSTHRLSLCLPSLATTHTHTHPLVSYVLHCPKYLIQSNTTEKQRSFLS